MRNALLDPTHLEVRARNISVAVPAGFLAADQLLTGVSWDFGASGAAPGDPLIIGGFVQVGVGSYTIDFDSGNYEPGADVSGEYGYSNLDGTGMLQNFFSANGAQTTPFGGPNLDGPPNLNGPQAGMVADPVLVPLGGVGAIQNEVIATLTIDQNLGDLNFLFENSVRVEFGSGAAFITIPEPGTLAGLAIGLSVLTRRARR